MHRRTWQFASSLAVAFSAVAFGQTNSVTSVSGANYTPIVAPDSIVSAWGSNFSGTAVAANTSGSGNQTITLPSMLGSVSLSLKDKGATVSTPGLYMVSPGQINYVTAANAALGPAMLTVKSGSTSQTGNVQLSNVAPAIYTADASGAGVPAGSVLRVTSGGTASLDTLFQVGTSTYLPKPFAVSAADTVYVVLYGTGIRNRSLNPAKATIGGTVVPVQYAGAQSLYPGFDQVNIGPLPTSLAGKGVTDCIVFVDGVPANTVQIAIQ